MKRNYTIQISRHICAIIVIAIHTFLFKDISDSLNHFTVNALSRFAVPFFFMITGYFYEKKVNLYYTPRYLRRIVKIYITWVLLYFPYDFIFRLIIERGIPLESAIPLYLKDTIWGGFNGAFFHLWYLLAVIIGLIVFDYLYRRGWLASKGAPLLFILLYTIGLAGTSYYGLWEVSEHQEIISAYERFFSTTRNGIFFGLPFIWMGYSISFYEDLLVRTKALNLKVILSLMLLTTEVFILRYYSLPHFLFGYDMTIGLLPFSFFLFILILRDPLRDFKTHRDLSLYIYLVHGFLLIVVYRLRWPHFSLNFLFVSTLSLILSLGIYTFIQMQSRRKMI